MLSSTCPPLYQLLPLLLLQPIPPPTISRYLRGRSEQGVEVLPFSHSDDFMGYILVSMTNEYGTCFIIILFSAETRGKQK